jgi:hypothetical protein
MSTRETSIFKDPNVAKPLSQLQEEFDDTKWAIRIRIPKNIQHNGEKKKGK